MGNTAEAIITKIHDKCVEIINRVLEIKQKTDEELSRCNGIMVRLNGATFSNEQAVNEFKESASQTLCSVDSKINKFKKKLDSLKDHFDKIDHQEQEFSSYKLDQSNEYKTKAKNYFKFVRKFVYYIRDIYQQNEKLLQDEYDKAQERINTIQISML